MMMLSQSNAPLTVRLAARRTTSGLPSVSLATTSAMRYQADTVVPEAAEKDRRGESRACGQSSSRRATEQQKWKAGGYQDKQGARGPSV